MTSIELRDNAHRVDVPGRVRRFDVCDWVRFNYRGTPAAGRIVDWVADFLDQGLVLSGGSGTSARYKIAGFDQWVYDWQIGGAR